LLWVGAWFYLNEQRGPEQPQKATTLQTTPSETINLTAPVEVTFDASNLSYDTRNYDVISYFWDFGDGAQGAGSSVETHRYERKGSGRYDVTITLTFRHKVTGEESTDTIKHIITIADEKVVAVLEADTTSGESPLTVSFDGSKSTDPDGTITSYAWEIDGGGFQEEDETFDHTFEQVGDFIVRLRVTNQKGDYDIAEQEITVEAGDQPQAVIEILNADDDTYYVDQTYTFDASKSFSPAGAITKYEWDFGDETAKKKTRTAQHAFSEEGVYKVVLSVIDEKGNTASLDKQMEVKVAASTPKAVMVTEPAKARPDDTSIQGTIPFEVNFDATQSTDPDDDIVDYKWDFDGDGEFDTTGEISSWVFKEVGTYTVSLTVIDSAGFESRSVLLVKALSRGLEAQVIADPVSGIVPLTVNFDATGSTYSDGQIVSYEWDFGDGSLPRSDIGQVTYKYTKIGNFNASVKVRTNDGEEETATLLISIRQVPLKSCFEPSSTAGNAPLTVTLNPQCATGTIAKYRWDFGDGETSAERKPTYTFASPGSYEVILEVADAQNVVDTSSQFITVTGTLVQ
jgi:PKD repeat protein